MLTEKEPENIRTGVSILVQEKQKIRSKTKKQARGYKDQIERKTTIFSFQLKNISTLLLYLILFIITISGLVVLDGTPHLPERIWNWQEIWTKLTGPSAGVPLDFIKYLACSIGWFMLAYITFTLIIESLVDFVFLLSTRFGRNQPGKIALGLKKITGRLPASPLRRAVDGLLLGATFFTVLTSVAGGQGSVAAQSNQAGLFNDSDPGLSMPETQAAALVLEMPHQAQVGSTGVDTVATRANSSSKFLPGNTSFNQNDSKGTAFTKADLPAIPSIPKVIEKADTTYLQSQKTGEVKYKVQPGDSLWKLAELYYGDGHLYTRIYQANLGQPVGGGAHFSVSGIIQPGWILTIPDVVGQGKLASNQDSVSTIIESQQEIYVVQRGDTMRSIAQKLLGDEMRWPEIWKLNANQVMKDGRIPTNPDLIYPGWELKLNAEPTVQPPSSASEKPTNPGQNGSEQSTATEQPNGGTSQPQTGETQTGGQTAANSTPTPVATTQPGSSSGIGGQTENGSPVNAEPGTPAQETVTAENPTPAAAPVTTPPIAVAPQQGTQTTNSIPGTQESQQFPNVSPGEWFWPVLEGLGGLTALAGLSFGLFKVGAVLYRKWLNGKPGLNHRSRWEALQDLNEWESKNAPQIKAAPLIQTDESGREIGFATSERPLELLSLLAKGFDVDKPKLILGHLQEICYNRGLPLLQPVSCIETQRQLIYYFTGRPQTLATYIVYADNGESDSRPHSNSSKTGLLTADNEEVDESAAQLELEELTHSSKGKVIRLPFLAGFRPSKGNSDKEDWVETFEKTGQGELAEAISSELGGIVRVEKQREGLVIILEDIEASSCYNPVVPVVDPESDAEADLEGDFENQAVSLTNADDDEEEAGVDSNIEERDVYEAYGPEGEEKLDAANFSENQNEEGLVEKPKGINPATHLHKLSYNQLNHEFSQISQDNNTLVSHHDLGLSAQEKKPRHLPSYLFFSLGATEIKPELIYGNTSLTQTENPSLSADGSKAYFQLCLETSRNLLLIAGKGDEAAQFVLHNALFQIAATAGPDDVAFYLIDRPIALSDEESGYIGKDLGLSEEAQTTLVQELKNNQQVFEALANLPQTVSTIEGDTRSSFNGEESNWSSKTTELIKLLLEELIRRRAENAVKEAKQNNEEDSVRVTSPRLVVAISDLGATATPARISSLTQLLQDGPEWGIYILAVGNYESIVLANPATEQSLAAFVNLFGSLGLFASPDERTSQLLLGGSAAAFNLTGFGDMFVRTTNKQLIRLRGFSTNIEQVAMGTELLFDLYGINSDEVEVGSHLKSAGEVGPAENAQMEEILTFVDATETDTNPTNFEHQAEVIKSDKKDPTKQSDSGHLEESTAEKSNSMSIEEVSGAINHWRWQMFSKGFLQAAITIYTLHGFSLHFGLLPAAKKNREGKGFFFPISPEPLAAYRLLREVGLNHTILTDYNSKIEDDNVTDNNENIKPERVDQILSAALILWAERNPNDFSYNQFTLHLRDQGFKAEEIEAAFNAAQNILHCFSWVESDNLVSKMQNTDLTLLSYLALHQGSQNSYTVAQTVLSATKTDKQMLRTLETRLMRTNKSLRNLVATGLQEIFGEEPGANEELPRLVDLNGYNFIEADTRQETLKLNDRLVWTDLWKFERLLAEYKRIPGSEIINRMRQLEEVYWLVQFTAAEHGDEVEDSRLKLLGIWGDHHAIDWEDLSVMRQHIVQRWFDLNLSLGDYHAQLLNSHSKQPQGENYLMLALEHYYQASLVQPTYAEPVKALMQLYHSVNDLSELRTVYHTYLANCKRDDQEPEEDVVELYHRMVGARNKGSGEELMQKQAV